MHCAKESQKVDGRQLAPTIIILVHDRTQFVIIKVIRRHNTNSGAKSSLPTKQASRSICSKLDLELESMHCAKESQKVDGRQLAPTIIIQVHDDRTQFVIIKVIRRHNTNRGAKSSLPTKQALMHLLLK
jgi:hypothetical protein